MRNSGRRFATCDPRRAALAASLFVWLLAGCERPIARDEVASALTGLDRPDLVLIVVDTLRADQTTPYAPGLDTTPELADWAARGVVFERVLAQSSWTKISMASFMTSLWPSSHGVDMPGDGLAEDATTLAELLRDAGYATYGVQTNGWLHQSFGFHQGFDRYLFPLGSGGVGNDSASVWSHADRVVHEAERMLAERDPDRPLFLYVHFMDVHEFAAPPEFQHYGSGTKAQYLSAIRWVDDAIRRVRIAVEAGARGDASVLVVASDHGETFGEHGVEGHARNVFTSVLDVPLVWRFPFAVEPIRVPTRVRNLDVAPTLLEIAGVPVPERFAGVSLLPLVARGADAEAAPDRPSIAALGFPLFPDAAVQTSIHEGAWVYARNAPTVEEGSPLVFRNSAAAPGAEFLFDRRLDPGENVNLADREAAERARMATQLEAHLREFPDEGVRQEDIRIDPAIADRLRAMGYLR
ncbi:MAG: sulfatase [Myxococcota bacterium]